MMARLVADGDLILPMPSHVRRSAPRRKRQHRSSRALGAVVVALFVLAVAVVGGLNRGSTKVVTAETTVLLQPTPDATVDAIVRGRATLAARPEVTATPAARAAATPTPARATGSSGAGVVRRP